MRLEVESAEMSFPQCRWAGWGTKVEVELVVTKTISSNMWEESGQGNLSYGTLRNTWCLGVISHNHPSGPPPDMPQVPGLGKETRALCPSWKWGPAPAIGGISHTRRSEGR